MSRVDPLFVGVLAAVAVLAGRGARAGDEVVAGPHYRLHWQGPRAEGEEMARLLEACWPPFTAFFGAAPPLKAGQALDVRFFADHAGWAAALRAAGVAPPSAGGYYNPNDRTAYLYRQPTRYYTRCLLVHEAAHQFHFLARTGNRPPGAGWYTEGVAEHLSWHWWDGETVVLGAVPLSLKDYPAAARKELADGTVTLEGLLEGASSRPAGCMLVRYLLEGETGRLKPAWSRLAKALDGGQRANRLFRSLFGSPAALQARFASWLETAQEPWSQVFNEWERIGADRFRGEAPGSIVSMARVKAPCARLEATLEIPAETQWLAGLLLFFGSPKDYVVAFAESTGSLSVRRFQGGTWSRLATVKLPPAARPGLLALSAAREQDRTVLSVEGTTLGRFALPPSSFGLSLQGCTVRFRDVRWTEAE